MKRLLTLAMTLLMAGVVVAASPAAKKDKNDSGRLLTGRIVDHNDQPLANAVVYLSNTRTRAVKTFITGPDGIYRFPALSPNIDYEVYAQASGKKSDTKTVSQFDERQTVNINLKVDTR